MNTDIGWLDMSKKLTPAEAAAYCGIKRSTLQKYRAKGGGPPFIKLGRVVTYDQRDCDRWLQAHKFNSTAEADYPTVASRRRQRHNVG